MEMTAVGDARHTLAQATSAPSPEAQLAAALTAAETLLRQGAPPDGRGLAALIAAAPPGWLDRREAVQLARLASVAERAVAAGDVDPLDADQAVRLVGALLGRAASGSSAPAVTSLPLASDRSATPFAVAEAPCPPPAAPPRVSVMGRLLRAGLWITLAAVLVSLGMLIIPLVGPAWSRWLVWLVAGGAMILALRDFLAVARIRPLTAATGALAIGLLVGVGWAAASDLGWLPPLTYVAGVTPGVGTFRSAPPPESSVEGVRVGGQALVVGTLGNGLRVRTQPTVGATEITRFPDGTTVSVLDGPRRADAFVWWRVRGNGGTGWVADEWLKPIR